MGREGSKVELNLMCRVQGSLIFFFIFASNSWLCIAIKYQSSTYSQVKADQHGNNLQCAQGQGFHKMAGVLSQLWAKLSEGWGERMGYTSCEVKTTTEEIVKLKNKMIKCINNSFYICELCVDIALLLFFLHCNLAFFPYNCQKGIHS